MKHLSWIIKSERFIHPEMDSKLQSPLLHTQRGTHTPCKVKEGSCTVAGDKNKTNLWHPLLDSDPKTTLGCLREKWIWGADKQSDKIRVFKGSQWWIKGGAGCSTQGFWALTLSLDLLTVISYQHSVSKLKFLGIRNGRNRVFISTFPPAENLLTSWLCAGSK